MDREGMAQIMQTRLVATMVLSMNLNNLTETSKRLLGNLDAERIARLGYEERRFMVLGMAQAPPSRRVTLKNESQFLTDRHQPVFVKLAEPNSQYLVDKIDIGEDE